MAGGLVQRGRAREGEAKKTYPSTVGVIDYLIRDATYPRANIPPSDVTSINQSIMGGFRRYFVYSTPKFVSFPFPFIQLFQVEEKLNNHK